MTELATIITAISLWCANPAFTKQHELRCRETLWECLQVEKLSYRNGFIRFQSVEASIQCFKDFGVKVNEEEKSGAKKP